jgi:hypothetical protein
VAKIGSVTLQIVRDWVLRFNAKGPEGLVTGRAPGASSLLNAEHRAALQQVGEQGPILAVHGVPDRDLQTDLEPRACDSPGPAAVEGLGRLLERSRSDQQITASVRRRAGGLGPDQLRQVLESAAPAILTRAEAVERSGGGVQPPGP